MARYLLTAALPYANGPIHIGHLAGCYLPADVYHRYLKAKGDDVLLICGTDEHGVAITLQARKEGVTPQELVDKNFKIIHEAFQGLGIEFSHFSRTSREIHHREARSFFLDLYNKGFLKEKTTSQFYDPVARTFLADRYLVGTCPHCGFDGAYGDQCENCGTSLSPDELKEPRSVLSGSVPEKRETNNWFLPMDEMLNLPEFAKYTERITRWKSNVKGQFHSWVQQGLQPRSMTRDLDWGVPVPLEGAENKVLYVWFDAPIGYLSATKEYMELQGNPEGWRAYWESEDSRLVHFIGKDNIVFHTLIFPMMLAAHDQMVLPWQVPANEFMNLEGRKISTSRGWAVWLHEYLRDVPGREDELRYTLLCNLPETKDADFSWQDFQLRVNSELVAILGNFVNRVMVLTRKLSNGQCGDLPSEDPNTAHGSLSLELDSTGKDIRLAMEQFRLREAMAGVIHLARLGNRYLAETEPWKMLKNDSEAASCVLRVAAELCAELCIALEPFLPFTATRLCSQLQWYPTDHDREAWWSTGSRCTYLTSGKQLGEPALLFTPIEDDFINAQVHKLQSMNDQNPQTAPTPSDPTPSDPTPSDPTPSDPTLSVPNSSLALKPEVSFDQFASMDLRIATILSAQPVPGADKVFEIKVDLGDEQRTVVSGIAQHFQPEALLGKQVLMLINLAPRKIRGIVSQGMLLMAENREGQLVLVGPSGTGIRPGDKVS